MCYELFRGHRATFITFFVIQVLFCTGRSKDHNRWTINRLSAPILSFEWEIYHYYFACFHLKGLNGSSHPWRDPRECLPVATFDNTVISSSHNMTMASHWLGHHKNLSSCVLHCCDTENCDVVLFDGHSCYSVFCSTEDVCRFQTVVQGQRSFQAVLLNSAFKSKLRQLLISRLWKLLP